MKKLLVFIPLYFLILQALAFEPGDDDKKAVMKVIEQLFDGMKEADSAKISATFYKPDNNPARLQSISVRNEQPVLQEETLQRFLEAIASPHDQVYDERLYDPVILVDDHMATVWVNYKFFIGDQFSHCGVNVFQLFKSDKGWKIVSITDTRRRDNCN